MTAAGRPKLTRTTLRSSVTEELRSQILSGDLRSGTHLGEIALSASLGVSRATLREALRQLEQDGLVIQDNRGRVIVREVLPRELADLFEVRLALESLAITRLCALPDRSQIVTQLRLRLDRLRTQSSLAEDLDADLAFHGDVCRLSGNEILLQNWQNISGLVRITMLAAGADPARENMTYDRHAPIVDLVERGDADAACHFLAEHMGTARDRLLERMNERETHADR